MDNELKLQKVINATYEEEAALINADTKEVIVKGDYYHDKIDQYIEGIFFGLDYVNMVYKRLPDILITPDMELFKTCEFYEGDEND